MAQTPSAMGWMDERQSSHTGSREMLTRGAPQMRQSEGNKVANRLSAMLPAEETNDATNALCFVTALDPLARVGYSLLLKTSLPRPAGATGAPTRTNPSQYSGATDRRAIAREGSGGRSLHRWMLHVGTFPHLYKVGAVVAPKAVSAAHWPQADQWQYTLLKKVTWAGTIAFNAPAVFTLERFGHHGWSTSDAGPEGRVALNVC